MLSFGEAVRQFYGNYVNAEGRAQRSAYWWVMLFQLIIYVVLTIVLYMADGGAELFTILGDMVNGDADETALDDFNLGISGLISIFLMVCFLFANILPGIMLAIRRFHDLGQSGWLVLVFTIVGALPLIGTLADIANIIWFAMPGTNGTNKYGRDPLGHDTDIFG